MILTRMNNEAKVRRSTKLVVLGKTKVMSLEDTEAARATRTANEVIKGMTGNAIVHALEAA